MVQLNLSWLCMVSLIAGLTAQASLIARDSHKKVCNSDNPYNAFPIGRDAQIQPQYNPGFEISYVDQVKVLKNNIANEIYVLYPCGTSLPTNNSGIPAVTPADSNQVNGWIKAFPIPLQSVGIATPQGLAGLDILGSSERNTVSKLTRFLTYINACTQTRSLPDDLHVDSNLELGVDAIFTDYSISNPYTISVNPEDASLLPLAQAEWIKFVAAFYNREKDANRWFAQVQTRYNCLAKSKSDSDKSKGPLFAFTRYNKRANQTVSSWAIISPTQAQLHYITNVGGRALTSEPLFFHNLDDFQKAVQSVDILVDESTEPLERGGTKISTYSDILKGYGLDDVDSSSYPFLSKQNVYRVDKEMGVNNATGSNEQMLFQPDAVLQDYLAMASDSSDSKSTRWFRNVARDELVHFIGGAQCNYADGPVPSYVSEDSKCYKLSDAAEKSLAALTASASTDQGRMRRL